MEENIKKSFKENINRLLKESNKNQSELAEFLGVSNQTITNYVKGINSPRMGKVDKIATFFGVKRSDLLEDTTVVNIGDNVNNIVQGNNNNNNLGDNNTFTINEAVQTENTLDDSIEKQNTSIKLQEDNDIVQNKMLEVLIDISKGINANLEISRDILTKINTGTIVDFKQHYLDKSNNYVDLDIYGSISAGTGLQLFDNIVETISYPEPVPTHDIALKVNGDSMSPMFSDGDVVFINKTTNINHGQIGAFIVNGEGFLKKFSRTEKGIKLISLNKEYKDIIISESDDISLVGTVIF